MCDDGPLVVGERERARETIFFKPQGKGMRSWWINREITLGFRILLSHMGDNYLIILNPAR
jgi:hypothetical protein